MSEYRTIYPPRIWEISGSDSAFRVSQAVTAPRMDLRLAQGTLGGPTTVVTGDDLALIRAYGHDGTGYILSSSILFDTEGTIGTDRVPGLIIFNTGTNAAPTVVTEAGRINSSQIWVLGSGEGGTTIATGRTLRAPNITTGGAGNIAAASLGIAGGLGTGTGTRSAITFQGSVPAGAGDNLQSLATIASMNTLGVTSSVPIIFDTGVAVTAAQYQVTRDADGTNQLHFNVPTGATFEFSANDVSLITLNGTNTLLNISKNYTQTGSGSTVVIGGNVSLVNTGSHQFI